MSLFSRKTTRQKQVEAAIKVASNLYEHTKPGAAGLEVPVQLQFSLPDSQYRYLIFCFSAMERACAREIKNPDAVVNECLHFLVTYTTTERAQEFFGGPLNPQDAANNGAAYFQDFLNNWSTCIELEKIGNNEQIIELICSMIHATESNEPARQIDKQRLWQQALQIYRWLPTMRDAFIELANR